MNLDRKYEKFTGEPNRPAAERLHVTLNEKGMIRMNATLYKTIGRPEAAYLYYNREKDHIVLEPTRLRMPSAFPFRESVGSYVVYAAPFCKHFGIRLDKVHRFISPEPETGGKLVLDLSNIVAVSHRRVSTKKRNEE